MPSYQYAVASLLLLTTVASSIESEEVVTLPSGLSYVVLRDGSPDGRSPEVTDRCLCHYEGSVLATGAVFDSSIKRGKPSTFAPNGVIKGWREALPMMREGAKWRLTIPPHLAYGARGAGPIPGSATLVFELQLIKVLGPSALSLALTAIANRDAAGMINAVEEAGVAGAAIAGLLIVIAIGCMINCGASLCVNGCGGGGPSLGSAMGADAAHSDSNPIVYLDVAIGNAKDAEPRRVTIELFANIVPRTAENFRCLCTGERATGVNAPNKIGQSRLHLKGTSFHRVIAGFMAQGGDTTKGNGRGGHSIYGARCLLPSVLPYVQLYSPYLLTLTSFLTYFLTYFQGSTTSGASRKAT